MIGISRLLSISKKEFIQIKRDKVALRIPLVMPIVWLFLLSYAFVVIPTNLSLSYKDQLKNGQSEKIIAQLQENEDIDLVASQKKGNNVITLTDDGKINLELNGIDFLNARALEAAVKKSLMSTDTEKITTKYTYHVMENTNLFVIPGLIGLVLQNIITFLTSISIVKEKEKGTYNQLLFSPVSFTELVIGKVIPYFLIGMFDLLLLSILSTFFFDVDVLARIIPYTIAGALFILSSLMLGILISAIAKNQMQALLYTVFILLPSILLSDFVFPVTSMPAILIWISKVMPLTHFNHLSREIIIKGTSILNLGYPILALSTITCGSLLISIAFLHRNRQV